MSLEVRRYTGNPLLTPRGDDWESVAVFNCAAAYKDNQIHILYRAVGDYVHYASSLGHAVFDKNLNLIERSDKPCFVPDLKLWEPSIEDPRLTEIDQELYITYVVTTTPAPPGAVRRRLGIPKPMQAYTRIALAVVMDFNNFKRLGVITPYRAKERAAVLFPEKIDGKYAVLHRPSNWIGPEYGTDRPSIWFAYLGSLDGGMFGHKLIMVPKEKWESHKIGPGPSPIKTESGWLLIYHGVGKDYVYRAGAALLDLEEPWKVIARTYEPILEPEEDYERAGDVPNVVFPEGAVVISNELLLFYGAADKVCCVARVSLKELVNHLITIAGR